MYCTYLQWISSYLHSCFHSFSLQRSDLKAERVILEILLTAAVVLWLRAVVKWPLQISLDIFPSNFIFSKSNKRSSNQSQVVKSSNSVSPHSSIPLVCTGQVCWHHKSLFLFFCSLSIFFSYLKSLKEAFTHCTTQHLCCTWHQTPICTIFIVLKTSGELFSS